MDLSALHVAVRNLVRKSEWEEQPTVSTAECRALQALRRRLASVGGELHRLLPPSGSLWWLASPETVAPAERQSLDRATRQ